MSTYYILGIGYRCDDLTQEYPYEIWLNTQEVNYPIVILEGKGRLGVGGYFKPSELLEAHWEEHIKLTCCEWLLPICRLAVNNGNNLDLGIVVESYFHIYGKEPEVVST